MVELSALKHHYDSLVKDIAKWTILAKAGGWNTYASASDGPICRGCHTECAPCGGSGLIWLSPKGGYYHRSCAIARLKREAGGRPK